MESPATNTQPSFDDGRGCGIYPFVAGRRPGCSWVRRLWRLIRWGAFGLAWAPVVIVLWPERPYRIDLLSHFAPHAAALILLCLPPLAIFRRWVALANAGVALALLAGLIRWNTTPPLGPGPVPEGYERIKLVHYNAYGNYSRHDEAFARWLEEQNADIVVIVDAPWRYAVAQPWLAERYPYRIEPRPGLEWPELLFSLYPFESATLIDQPDEITKFSFIANRSVVVTLPGGARLLLSGTHPPSPRRFETWRSGLRGAGRDGQLLRQWEERHGLPILIAGDFNSTPTGALHALFRSQSGLVGWTPLLDAGTWPAKLPTWLALPIDRIWTTPDVQVRTIEVGPRFASDHRPLVAVLDVPRQALGVTPRPVPPSEGEIPGSIAQ